MLRIKDLKPGDRFIYASALDKELLQYDKIDVYTLVEGQLRGYEPKLGVLHNDGAISPHIDPETVIYKVIM